MLSALSGALRSGALATSRSTVAARCLRLSSVRASSDETQLDRWKSSDETQLDRWKRLNSIYYGPERDHENFPIAKQETFGGKVRFGFIPDEWFQAFYDKTGVTGPYVFGAGVLTWAFSKEIWVLDHWFTEIPSFWGAILLIHYKWGRQIGEFLYAHQDKYTEKQVDSRIVKIQMQLEEGIKNQEEVIWQQEGKKYLSQARKENAMFQLEALYRERLQNVYKQVKNRLDYQIDIQHTKTRFEHDHMVNWIVNNVITSITPQQEKDSITKCIADLRKLVPAV